MSFEDIKGQDRVLAILKENIARNRIFSSYLFIGPDGIGKFLAAKNFAKAINCQSKKKPCEECISCKKITSRVHPDVFFVEPKGASLSIGIDEIRNSIGQANLKPYEAQKKVFIINNAYSMNAESANAFLKTLEEPPKNTVFILISRSKAELLPTIVSRCHVVRFFSAPVELVEKILKEKFDIKENEARILSNFSSGRIGEAIRMKETNLLDRKNRVIDSLLDRKRDFSEDVGSYSDRNEFKENMEFIISFFRDVFIYKQAKNESLIFHVDRFNDIKDKAENTTPEKLDYLIKKLITLRSYIDSNVNPKIIIDVMSNDIRKALLCSR